MNGLRTRGCVKDKREKRGQSEVVGLITIFGIVFVSISIILLAGLPLLDNARENTQLERFQSEFTLLDQQIRESIYAPGQSSASISLSDGRVSVDDGSDSMTVNITYRPNSSAPVSTGEMRLGGIEFDAGGDRGVVYQGGGVWAKYRGGGISVRTLPDISYTGDTLNMDLMNFTTEFAAGGDTTRTFYLSSEGTRRSDELQNITSSPLETGELEISVRSEVERGWAEYFERALVDGSGSLDVESGDSPEDRGFANVTLRTGPPLYGVEYLGGRYETNGVGAGCPLFPSPLCPDNDKQVIIYDSRAGSEREFNRTVDSDTVVSPASIELPVSADDLETCLRSRSETTETFPPPSNTVTTGVYEANAVAMGDYEFDTESGPVEILVDNDLELNTGADISVNGSNPVILHVGQNVDIADPDISLQGSRTELFQIYSGNSGSINVDNGGNYTGTIYAPASSITIKREAEFRGAAIGNNVVVDEDGGVSGEYYHDASLRQADVPDCIDPPLRNLNAVERRIAVR